MTSVVKTVYTLQPPAVQSGGLPADTQTRAPSKSLLPVKSKEVDVSRLHSGGAENDVTKIIKPRRENGQVKAADTAFRRNIRKSYKPLSKQKSEEELKDKNQLLEAVNKQLHQKLTETQGELKDLTQKVELLEKFQDNCLAILESKGLNPDFRHLQSCFHRYQIRYSHPHCHHPPSLRLPPKPPHPLKFPPRPKLSFPPKTPPRPPPKFPEPLRPLWLEEALAISYLDRFSAELKGKQIELLTISKTRTEGGSETLASRQEATTDHTDSMLLLETLQDELKLFNETAKKQMEELQALKVKLKMKEEERARFLEQQTLCNSQVHDFTTALEEMEQLLEM
ncbi:small kinetochore-associated protein isoform X2 [Prionailurus iriomotensis]